VAFSHGFTSGGQIGALCAESFCERMFCEANIMCHGGNMLLDTEEISMLVVLRKNREFIQHMREIYPKFSGQNCNGTLVKVVIWVRNLTDFKFWKIIMKESIFEQSKLELRRLSSRKHIFGF